MITEIDLFFYNSLLFKEGILLGMFTWTSIILIFLLMVALIKNFNNRYNLGRGQD